MRKGLSLSMNMIVIALIISLVAITVLVAFSSNFETINSFISGGIDDATLDLAAENCLADFDRLCAKTSYEEGDTSWATDATYNGRTCEYWINQGALGGEINGCGTPYE